jgi:hypothetical protein
MANCRPRVVSQQDSPIAPMHDNQGILRADSEGPSHKPHHGEGEGRGEGRGHESGRADEPLSAAFKPPPRSRLVNSTTTKTPHRQKTKHSMGAFWPPSPSKGYHVVAMQLGSRTDAQARVARNVRARVRTSSTRGEVEGRGEERGKKRRAGQMNFYRLPSSPLHGGQVASLPWQGAPCICRATQVANRRPSPGGTTCAGAHAPDNAKQSSSTGRGKGVMGGALTPQRGTQTSPQRPAKPKSAPPPPFTSPCPTT